MQNLVIKTKSVDGVYEASLVYGEPELGVGGAINVSARDYSSHKAGQVLVKLIRAIGYKGSFRVEGVIEEIDALEDAPVFSDRVKVPSDNGISEYTVTYDESADPIYSCTCPDFKFRKGPDGEACKHICRAITYYRLGSGRDAARHYADERGIWID